MAAGAAGGSRTSFRPVLTFCLQLYTFVNRCPRKPRYVARAVPKRMIGRLALTAKT